MSILAVDTTSRTMGWLARTDAAGEVDAERGVAGGRLDRELAAALVALGSGPIAAVVVLTGPGSYTGVRAGMAAALGFASARAVPLHGVDSLTALAAAAQRRGWSDHGVTTVADAGRGGVYVAEFPPGGAGGLGDATIQRVEAASVPRHGRVVSTSAIAGLDTDRLTPMEALAAAVPVALARAPLQAAGLAAAHAQA